MERKMSKRKTIDVTYHDDSPPKPLTGWYWSCGCDKCRGSAEWHHYGPFKTRRQARADGMKGGKAAPVRVPMRVEEVSETPTQIARIARIANVHAATAAWADRVSRAFAGAYLESLTPSGLHH
jgi:hypothetical protein